MGKIGDTIPAARRIGRWWSAHTASGVTAPAAKWTAHGAGGWYLVTRCGSGYDIGFRKGKAKDPTPLDRADTLDGAKQICEAHNEQQ